MYAHYRDRADAAAKLSHFLAQYKNEAVVLMAVPRGGVPLACSIATRLHFPIELLMTKKIGHPGNPEFAIGAVSLEDYLIDNGTDIPASYIMEKVEKIRKNLINRYQLFMGTGHKPEDLQNKIVIIIDDGMATGNTILSSVKMLRRQNPRKIIVAVPVAPPSAIEKVQSQVDEVICPYMPENFISVGTHYADFSEVSDDKVIRMLRDIDKTKVQPKYM